jgi:hypothetical protein
MTTTQRIKDALVSYLTDNSPADSILVTDANARTDLTLPCIAVDIQGSAAHSVALHMVSTADVSITLRAHTGDEPEADIAAWIDQLETLFFDQSAMVDALNQSQVIFWDWTYNGSVQNWDEALLEVTFTAACTFGRI